MSQLSTKASPQVTTFLDAYDVFAQTSALSSEDPNDSRLLEFEQQLWQLREFVFEKLTISEEVEVVASDDTPHSSSRRKSRSPRAVRKRVNSSSLVNNLTSSPSSPSSPTFNPPSTPPTTPRHSRRSSFNSQEATTEIRKLGRLTCEDVTRLLTSLTELMNNRAIEKVTGDEEAQRAMLDETSVTIPRMTAVKVSRIAYLAAAIYARLISSSGSFGAGFVDTATLSSLAALMRRWARDNDTEKELKDNAKGANDAKGKKGGKRTRSTRFTRGRKRSKRNGESEMDDNDDEYDDDNHDDTDFAGSDDETRTDVKSEAVPASFTPATAILGANIASTLSATCSLSSFTSFSDDASELLVEICTVSLSGACAILSHGAKNLSRSEMGKALEVKTKMTEALLAATSAPNMTLRRRHTLAVFLLRGLLPVLSLNVEVVNGQKGKLGAHEGAACCLEHIVKELAGFDFEHQSKQDQRAYQAYQERQERMDEEDRAQQSVLLSPLKINAGSKQPRPILSAIIGMLQKISTVSLERVDARQRIALLIMRCLPMLPKTERTHFLKFFVKLVKSKRPMHRLFATEVAGKLLMEDWLWTEHLDGGRPMDSEDQGNIVDNGDDEDDDEDNEVGGDAMEDGLSITTATTTSTKSTNYYNTAVLEGLGERDPTRCIPLNVFSQLSGRLSDKIPGVRARAAQSISDIMAFALRATKKKNAAFWIKSAARSSMGVEFSLSLRKRAEGDERASARKCAVTALVAFLCIKKKVDASDIAVLEQRCGDESIATRKCAAGGLTELLLAAKENVDLELAWARSVLPLAMDTEVTCVNKGLELFRQVVLVPLLNADDEKDAMSAWRILSKMSDSGGSSRSGAKGGMNALKTALKRNLDDFPENSLPLLKILKVAAVKSLGLETTKIKLFGQSITFMREGVWCMLEAFASCSSITASNKNRNGPSSGTGNSTKSFDLISAVKKSKLDGSFLVSAWDKFRELRSKPDDIPDNRMLISIACSTRSCLKVVSELASIVPTADAKQSAKSMKSLLVNFAIDPPLISSCIHALTSLTVTSSDTKDAAVKSCEDWVGSLYERCEKKLEQFMNSNVKNFAALDRALFTVGEASMVGFTVDEDSAALALKKKKKKSTSSHAFFAGCDDDGKEDKPKKGNKKKSTESWTTGIHVTPPPRLVELIHYLLPPKMPHNVGNKVEIENPANARALAFVALGKVCLRNAELAKDIVNILASELHFDRNDVETSNSSAAVRSNALVVLGDLCVRYTSLVDRQLPAMAECLQDGIEFGDANCAMVRRHAVLLLSSLLLQDYVKWRGLLVHRYLAATCDKDVSVAQMAEMTLCGPLLRKNPLLFSNNFVESIFVFNRSTNHPIFKNAASSGDNGAGAVDFDCNMLVGARKKGLRMQIYKMMLASMSDEMKIGVVARLAKEVLGGAVNGGKLMGGCKRMGDIEKDVGEQGINYVKDCQASADVLGDCFSILLCAEVRVRSGTGKDDEEEKESFEENGGINGNAVISQQLAAAKGKLLNKISRKHLIESVVPVLCELKNVFEANKSPLLKSLMRYLREVFKLYNYEVKEVLANDPVLLAELTYDMKKFTDMQARERKMREAEEEREKRMQEEEREARGLFADEDGDMDPVMVYKNKENSNSNSGGGALEGVGGEMSGSVGASVLGGGVLGGVAVAPQPIVKAKGKQTVAVGAVEKNSDKRKKEEGRSVFEELRNFTE